MELWLQPRGGSENVNTEEKEEEPQKVLSGSMKFEPFQLKNEARLFVKVIQATICFLRRWSLPFAHQGILSIVFWSPP